MGFYEEIAGSYDEVVGRAGREDAARRLVDWLICERGVGRVLDVACGTGLHAGLLAERGVAVTASDASEAMVAQARRRLGPTAGRIRWLHAPMEDVAAEAHGPFDAILCLGNSLPHLLTDEQLDRAVRGWRGLLAPGGVALVQWLNYGRILERRERIVGVTREGPTEYVRFYDFLEERVRFNLLILRWEAGRCGHELHETTLRPWRPEQVGSAFEEGGFARPAFHGGMPEARFDPHESEVVMLIAARDRTAGISPQPGPP
jgi:SAM-dependent methyltransferase